MPDEQHKEWRNLTFAQREGKAPSPQSLRLEELSSNFRRRMWKTVEESISDSYYDGMHALKFLPGFWKRISFSYYFEILEIPHDEVYRNNPKDFRDDMREIILNGEYHEVLTVLEHMIRRPDIPKKLSASIKDIFQFAPYYIDDSQQPFCIIPTLTPETKEATQHAFDNIEKAGMAGAKEHLLKSSRMINEGAFPDAIRESIHAVEAVARNVTSKRDLSSALNSLHKAGKIKHPALISGIKSLYGYASDVPGVRHSDPSPDTKKSPVSINDAFLIFGICASLASYLANLDRMDESES